jgi:hypothetical protein
MRAIALEKPASIETKPLRPVDLPTREHWRCRVFVMSRPVQWMRRLLAVAGI